MASSSRALRAFGAVLFMAAGVTGASVRFLGKIPLVHTDTVYSPAREERIPGADDPESAAKSFYMYLDRGCYEKAYDTALEPAPPREAGGEGGRPPERTPKDEFVSRMNSELGPGGAGIRLGNIRAKKAGRLAGGDGSAGTRAGASPPSETCSEGACRVAVNGHMLGACSIFRWEKTVTVLKRGGKYRVLLDAPAGGKAPSYRAWFENVEKIADLRGVAE